MRSSHLKILLAAVLLLTVLAACTRPASKAPVSQATATSELPFPMPGQPTVIKDIASGTQTAMAMTTPQVINTQPPAALDTAVIVATPIPPTATPVIVYTATPGIPSTYTLQLGDTFFCLARRYNLDPQAIISANPSLNPNSVRDGTTVNLPQGPVWPDSLGSRALHSHPDTYTVDPGDTIYKVACYYGDVSPEMIAQANGLESPYTLSTGQKLTIP